MPRVQAVTRPYAPLTKKEATNPGATPRRLALLASRYPLEVLANPALPLIALSDPREWDAVLLAAWGALVHGQEWVVFGASLSTGERTRVPHITPPVARKFALWVVAQIRTALGAPPGTTLYGEGVHEHIGENIGEPMDYALEPGEQQSKPFDMVVLAYSALCSFAEQRAEEKGEHEGWAHVAAARKGLDRLAEMTGKTTTWPIAPMHANRRRRR